MSRSDFSEKKKGFPYLQITDGDSYTDEERKNNFLKIRRDVHQTCFPANG